MIRQTVTALLLSGLMAQAQAYWVTCVNEYSRLPESVQLKGVNSIEEARNYISNNPLFGDYHGPSCRDGAAVEPETDRPGKDYSNFQLPSADASLCRAECQRDNRCKSWTYVRPSTIQGPQPRCWLKDGKPGQQDASCCVSGVK